MCSRYTRCRCNMLHPIDCERYPEPPTGQWLANRGCERKKNAGNHNLSACLSKSMYEAPRVSDNGTELGIRGNTLCRHLELDWWGHCSFVSLMGGLQLQLPHGVTVGPVPVIHVHTLRMSTQLLSPFESHSIFGIFDFQCVIGLAFYAARHGIHDLVSS